MFVLSFLFVLSSSAFRITVDASQLLDTVDDRYKCRSSAQSVTWNNNTYQCTSADLLSQYSATRINAIGSTVNNVVKLLTQALSVTPLKNPINLQFYDGAADVTATTAPDTDFHLTVVARPFGNITLPAYGLSIQTDPLSKRPIQGFLFVNPRYIPVSIESESTAQNYYFSHYLHESLHALGLSFQNLPDWHPRNSNKPYEVTTCTLWFGSIPRTYLITPFSQRVVLMRFGLETFYNHSEYCPAGLELQNNPNTMTPTFDPSPRLFYTDIMSTINIQGPLQFSRLTEVTMAMLLDTGFYDVSYAKFKPLLWGSWEILGAALDPGFATGAPSNVFPPNHLINLSLKSSSTTTTARQAGFDFAFVGTFFSQTVPECDDSEHPLYCNNVEFFNPLSQPRVGSPWLDYQLVITNVTQVCAYTSAALPDSAGSECVPVKCNSDQTSFTFDGIDGGKYSCSAKGQTVSYKQVVGGITGTVTHDITCPDPHIFCSYLTYRNIYLPFNPFEFIPGPPPDSNQAEGSGSNSGWIAFGVTIGIIVLVFVGVAVFIFLKKKGVVDDGRNNALLKYIDSSNDQQNDETPQAP